MPNLLAHTLLVKRLYNVEVETHRIDNSFLKGNSIYFFLGALGPDPLFYMGILPFHGLHLPTACKKVGNQLHKLDGKKFFKLMVEQLYGIDIVAEKNKLESFVLGQIAHYILDRETHPYIMYMSGFDDDGRITGNYHYAHAFFETNIDAALAKTNSMNRFLSHPEETIPECKERCQIIDKYLVPVLKECFGIKRLPKNMYTNAVNNMRILLKSMNNHGKIKSKLIGKKIALSAMYIPSEIDMSVLNEEKNIWRDPCTGIESNESFIELNSRAYSILEKCYQDILRNGFNYAVVNKYLDGRDYYGSKPGSKRKFKAENDKKDA